MTETINQLSNYIHISKYAKYLEKEQRRETWEESVDRIITFWQSQIDKMGLSEENKQHILGVLG